MPKPKIERYIIKRNEILIELYVNNATFYNDFSLEHFYLLLFYKKLLKKSTWVSLRQAGEVCISHCCMKPTVLHLFIVTRNVSLTYADWSVDTGRMLCCPIHWKEKKYFKHWFHLQCPSYLLNHFSSTSCSLVNVKLLNSYYNGGLGHSTTLCCKDLMIKCKYIAKAD